MVSEDVRRLTPRREEEGVLVGPISGTRTRVWEEVNKSLVVECPVVPVSSFPTPSGPEVESQERETGVIVLCWRGR